MESISIPSIDNERYFFDDEYADSFDQMVESIWKKVFDNIKSGKIPYAFYDTGSSDSYNRYIFHRSTKKSGYIQISVVWYKNGQINPLSDRQVILWDDFRREIAAKNGITLKIADEI